MSAGAEVFERHKVERRGLCEVPASGAWVAYAAAGAVRVDRAYISRVL
jgi:hypothetical protein